MRQDDANHNSFLTGTGGTSGSMEVVLVGLGGIHLEHQGDVVDMDAAGGDVGGHQDGHLSSLESREDTGTGTLGEASVQRPGHHPGLTQLPRDAVGSHLGAGEDHGPAFPVRDLGSGLVLVVRSHVQHVMGHGGHRCLAGVHLMGDRIGEVLPDQCVHCTVKGGGEEEPLPVRGHGLEDGGDGGQEPEVAHVVRLIENQHLHPAEVDRPLFEEIDQPAGSGHHHVHAALESLELGTVGHATRHQVQVKSHHCSQW